MGQENLHYPALLSKIKELAEQNTIILAWLDNGYFPVFRIWYYFFKQHNLKNILVFSLDAGVERKLNALGVPTYRIDRAYTSKREIWGGRPAIVREIIASGTNVMQTDIDAFWLKNITDIVYNSPHDLSISIAYGIPKEIVQKWGFTLCCGFYFLRSNARTKAFLDESEFTSRSQKVGSDQSGMNWTLFNNGITWSLQESTNNQGYLKKYDMQIEAISTALISRHADENGEKEVYIYHPALKGLDGYEKVADAIKKLTRLEVSDKQLSAFYTQRFVDKDYWSSQAIRLGKKGYKKLKRTLMR